MPPQPSPGLRASSAWHMEQETTRESGQVEALAPLPMDAILRGETRPEPRAETDRQPVEAKAPETVAPKGEPAKAEASSERDESGRFKAKEQQDAAPPAAEKEADRVPLTALKEERGKRQALEAELARARQFIEQVQRQQQVAPQPPAPQPQQQDHLGALLDDPSQFVGQQVRQAVQTVEQQAFQRHIAMSRSFVAAQAADYEQAEAALNEYVARNPQFGPHVGQALRNHPNPAQWALEQGRALLRQQRWAEVMAAHADPDAFVASRAPARPEIEERDELPPSRSLPVSLASARSAGAPRSASAWSGPAPLSSIIGPRTR